VDVAEQTAGDIRQLGRDSMALQADVRESADMHRMVDAVLERFGKIDILIINAGIGGSSPPIVDLSEEQWDTMMDIHVKGTMLCSQAVGREMIKKKKGNIINMSSISGFIVNRPQDQVSYNTAKAAVSHFTKSLAMEWLRYNIRVNAIAPGYFRTPMTAKSLASERAEEWEKLTPMGRVGEPEEIKGLALFLASNASSYVTGSVILIDGGYICW
jgi:NAD(P)-dependent dehydrogenase (short-subunit alcohol dehydrogenase family)